MSKIFIVYGHYSDQSFNAAIRDTFIETAKQQGHSIDCVDLYKENFDPVFRGEEPDKTVIDHRERIKKSDTIVLIAPIWNFRMPAILEGWIDKVLAPPFAFTFKKLWGNYGYPIGNLKDKKARPAILQYIAEELKAKKPVGINTGRSSHTVMKRVVNPLTANHFDKSFLKKLQKYFI